MNARSKIVSIIVSSTIIGAVAVTVEWSQRVAAQPIVNPDSTCNRPNPCIEKDNLGLGVGLKGVAVNASGVFGDTTFIGTKSKNKSGVFGLDDSHSGSFNSGVFGKSTGGTGVIGESSTNNGVLGTSTGGTNTSGVLGQSHGGSGVTGTSFLASGIMGFGNYAGVYGIAGNGNSGTGVIGAGDIGVYGQGISTGVRGLDISAGVAVQAKDYGGIAVQAVGGELLGNFGLLFDGVSGNSGVDVFKVDDNGNVQAHSFTADLADINGRKVVTYTPQATEPSIEDFGEGQLTNGSAYVLIDGRFARTMANGATYFVFVTPEGMTHGTLCVTQRTPMGFHVQENQGGRSNVAFAYRIMARPFGNQAPRLPYTVEKHRDIRNITPLIKLMKQPSGS